MPNSTLHPYWYYPVYERIFAPSRLYKEEIHLIHRCTPFSGRTVEEIGAGTGNHAAEILSYSPSKLSLIDVDATAIGILRARFRGNPVVSIVHTDGFSLDTGADIVVCFYSILQQTSSVDLALSRLERLSRRIQSGALGSVWLEWMDVDIHLAANLGKGPTTLLESGSDFLAIETFESSTGAVIRYSGVLSGAETEYCIPIVRLPLSTLEGEAWRFTLGLQTYPLTSTNRRLLLRFDTSHRGNTGTRAPPRAL